MTSTKGPIKLGAILPCGCDSKTERHTKLCEYAGQVIEFELVAKTQRGSDPLGELIDIAADAGRKVGDLVNLARHTHDARGMFDAVQAMPEDEAKTLLAAAVLFIMDQMR